MFVQGIGQGAVSERVACRGWPWRFLMLFSLVGPDRLELSTSVLSGLRSNHLSYGPQGC